MKSENTQRTRHFTKLSNFVGARCILAIQVLIPSKKKQPKTIQKNVLIHFAQPERKMNNLATGSNKFLKFWMYPLRHCDRHPIY